MKIVSQDKNALYKLYRKDELCRLKRKLQQIKSRKSKQPLSHSINSPSNTCSLPRLKLPTSHSRSHLPQRIQEILTQNKRLLGKINQSIVQGKRSELKLTESEDINKAYGFKENTPSFRKEIQKKKKTKRLKENNQKSNQETNNQNRQKSEQNDIKTKAGKLMNSVERTKGII